LGEMAGVDHIVDLLGQDCLGGEFLGIREAEIGEDVVSPAMVRVFVPRWRCRSSTVFSLRSIRSTSCLGVSDA
jgi:hypothetical protein